jgi:hypothetical protein
MQKSSAFDVPAIATMASRMVMMVCLFILFCFILLVSTKNVLVTNYIDFGNRQAPFFKGVNGCPRN